MLGNNPAAFGGLGKILDWVSTIGSFTIRSVGGNIPGVCSAFGKFDAAFSDFDNTLD